MNIHDIYASYGSCQVTSVCKCEKVGLSTNLPDHSLTVQVIESLSSVNKCDTDMNTMTNLILVKNDAIHVDVECPGSRIKYGSRIKGNRWARWVFRCWLNYFNSGVYLFFS